MNRSRFAPSASSRPQRNIVSAARLKRTIRCVSFTVMIASIAEPTIAARLCLARVERGLDMRGARLGAHALAEDIAEPDAEHDEVQHQVDRGKQGMLAAIGRSSEIDDHQGRCTGDGGSDREPPYAGPLAARLRRPSGASSSERGLPRESGRI